MTSLARRISNGICSSDSATADLWDASDVSRRRAAPAWHAIALRGSVSSWRNFRQTESTRIRAVGGISTPRFAIEGQNFLVLILFNTRSAKSSRVDSQRHARKLNLC